MKTQTTVYDSQIKFTVEKASQWKTLKKSVLKFLPLQGSFLSGFMSQISFWKASAKSFHLPIRLDLYLQEEENMVNSLKPKISVYRLKRKHQKSDKRYLRAQEKTHLLSFLLELFNLSLKINQHQPPSPFSLSPQVHEAEQKT